MIRLGRRDILGPGEMFPAGDATYRVSFPRLESGIRIRVVERGDPAAPPIVLVHGWGCTVYVFRFNIPALADAGYRVVALDLKGHGLSDKPRGAGEYTIDALVEHVRQALDAVGLAHPVLAGHSLGGSLVYHFAARHSQRLSGIGLIAPAGLTGVPLMRLYRLLTPGVLNPLMSRVRSRTVVKIALRRVYGKRGHFSARDVEEYVAPSQFPEYGPAIRQVLHSYDWKAAEHRQLPVVNLPAVGVWGTRDHMMPDNGMEIYRTLLPQIELTSVVDAGHVVPEETPREVNEALLRLLHRVYSGR
jgi:pimeloyl-ACP methyl ester carboxylesterase